MRTEGSGMLEERVASTGQKTMPIAQAWSPPLAETRSWGYGINRKRTSAPSDMPLYQMALFGLLNVHVQPRPHPTYIRDNEHPEGICAPWYLKDNFTFRRVDTTLFNPHRSTR